MHPVKQITVILCSVIFLFVTPYSPGAAVEKTKPTSSPPSQEATAKSDQSAEMTIDELFNSPDTDWKRRFGTVAPAKFVTYNHQRGYQFNCDFSQVKGRCAWDVEHLDIDLSHKSFISFDIEITVPSSIGFLTLYFRFGHKWIYQAIKCIEGRQKVIINLDGKGFSTAKNEPVTAIRFSPWKANNNKTQITIFNVKSGSGKCFVMPNPVWYKKTAKVVAAKDFNLQTISQLPFKNYSSNSHLFLIGKPVKLIVHKGFLALPRELNIESHDDTIDAGLKKLISRYFTTTAGSSKITVNCAIEPNLAVPGQLSEQARQRFSSPEAYYLKISSNGITLIGRSHVGILRGLASIALLGASQKSRRDQVISNAEIWQAPSIGVRMYEGGSNQPTLARRKEIVDLLYLLRYNAHVVQMLGYVGSGTQFPFDSLPKKLRANRSTKAQWQELNQYYKSRGIELIPKMFTFSRAGLILSQPAYHNLAETGRGGKKLKKDKNNQNFCSTNPKSYKLVFKLLNELITTLHPKIIHIGLDEVMLGPLSCQQHCASTKTDADWLRDVVLKTHQFLQSKGVSTLMYGDMLDPYQNGGQIGINNWQFAQKLPKDIIIGDWKYNIRNHYPSIAKFTKLGFRTLGIPWDEPENWFNMVKEIIQDKAYGLCGVAWGGIYPSRVYHSRAATLALGASLCWSPALQSLSQLPIQPVSKIYKQICYPQKMELPYAKNIRHIIVKEDILTDKKLSKAMQFPLVYNLNAVIAATQNYRGVSFIPFDKQAKMSALVLLPKQTPIKIAVAARAKHITFLHGTSRLTDESGNSVYQQYRQFNAGKYIIRYQDGKTQSITLSFFQNITGWNSRMLASFVETGIFGSIGNKIHLNIPSYTWTNPFPNKLITEIEVIPGNCKDTALILYGLTLDN